jgi:hypothetical protein
MSVIGSFDHLRLKYKRVEMKFSIRQENKRKSSKACCMERVKHKLFHFMHFSAFTITTQNKFNPREIHSQSMTQIFLDQEQNKL